jgi:hypothetical protein
MSTGPDRGNGGEGGEGAAVPGSDPLAVLFAEVEARTGAPLAELARDHVGAALDAYLRVASELEPAARGAMAPLVPRVLRDAALVRDLMRDDPAAPGLEESYYLLLSELSDLAATFASADPVARHAPDPLDEYLGEYAEVCAEIPALMEAARTAQPAWRLLRLSYAAGRGRPPPRDRAPVAPTDDQEYYL